MSSTIMLAKSYDEKRIKFPVEVSIKLDGIAADFYKTEEGWAVQSRQGKPILSVNHIVKFMDRHYETVTVGTHIVGELTVVGVSDFKTAGGIIRRKEVDRRIILNVYDTYETNRLLATYSQRVNKIEDILGITDAVTSDGDIIWKLVQRVPIQGLAKDVKALMEYVQRIPDLMKRSHLWEGLVFRTMEGDDSLYNVGKRSHGMIKYKLRPTIDLEVVSFDEAHANTDMTFLDEDFTKGEGLGAVGRINVLYKGDVIGVGPGCLTHEERRKLWTRYIKAERPNLLNTGLIAEVEYMHDATYDALRQPTFQRWRTDKSTESLEG